MQVAELIPRLTQLGLDVAMLSNYGLDGAVSDITTPHGRIPHFPRGIDPYSNDVAPVDHINFVNRKPNQPNLFLSLYDVWVMTSPLYDKFTIASWTPLDHISMPPKVEAWLRKENVTPIAMAPNGVQQMTEKSIDCVYIPHSINTKTFSRTDKIGEQPVREYMDTEGKFVVGMVAANKASGLVHRKAFSQNLLAFSIFRQSHPDAVLYLHTDPFGRTGGWNLFHILAAAGIPSEAVKFPNPDEYRYGIPQDQLAGLYSGMDVLLAPSYGEGFGVPTIEAQACGVRVIGSNWAASKDLISKDGWLVEGQAEWDAGQDAWWMSPSVPSIVNALEAAYAAPRGHSEASREFALQFDSNKVWKDYWLPTLTKLLR